MKIIIPKQLRWRSKVIRVVEGIYVYKIEILVKGWRKIVYAGGEI